MKRLWIFLALFGLGLLGLVLWLGPARVLRDSVETTIAASDLDSVKSPIRLDTAGEGAGSIGFELRGAGRIPIWEETIEPDGTRLRVKTALLVHEGVEPFAGGFHLTRPSFELYPGRATDERPSTVLESGAADLATRSDFSQPGQLAQGLVGEDLRAFTLAGSVLVKQLDAQGAVTFTMETERLEAPETPLDEAGRAPAARRLVAPGPVRFLQADGGFDLHAGAMDLDRETGRIELAAPIAIAGTDLALPGLSKPGARAGTAARPPSHLTADGPATFVRSGEPSGAGDVLGLAGVIGPGELLFTRNVLMRQEERWLRSDRVLLELASDETGALRVARFDAGGAPATVALGLMGGEVRARAAHWREADGDLVLDGPLSASDLLLGEGDDRRKLELSARDRLTARELPAQDGLPDRVRIELESGARARIDGGLDARAERIVAELVPPRGGEGGARLLEVVLSGRESATGDGPAPGEDADELATAELPGRGEGQARTIRLEEDGAGGQIAHLDGDARAELDSGFAAGDEIDLFVPADPALPVRIDVRSLRSGELELPAGGSPFQAKFAAGAAAADGAVPRIRLEPVGACSLTVAGEATDVAGRCRFRVRGEERDLQVLDADELHLEPDAAGEMGARALGDVVLEDLDHGLKLHADTARTERDAAGHRLLRIAGAPALAIVKVRDDAGNDVGEARIRGAAITLDLDTGELLADDERDRVHLVVPESLLAGLLPAVTPADGEVAAPAASDPVTTFIELDGEHLRIEPAEGALAPREALRGGSFTLRGRVTGARPRDGATLEGDSLRVDFAQRSGRLDGTPERPCAVRRPKPYAADRVESIAAAWIEVRDGARFAQLAPLSILVFHAEDPPTRESPVPRRLRIEVRASDAPRLEGDRLRFTGGVEYFISNGSDEIEARSERAELLFDRALDEGPVTPLRFNATPRVRMHRPYEAEAALLTYDFTTNVLELKEGIEPASFLAQDARGDWRVSMLFQRLLQQFPEGGGPLLPPSIVGGRLLLEGLRGR
jgi:hypothetical protein